MNYWKRYAGDYLRDTGHLSVTEHGAYTLLLDHYYSKRNPLPSSIDALCRLCRATTKLEQDAVKAVAEEFFALEDDGLRHNPRADREIAEWERLAQINRERGKLGGRPKRNPGANPPGNPPGNPPANPAGTREVIFSQPSPAPAPTPTPEPAPEPDLGVLEDSDSRQHKRRLATGRPAYRGRDFHDLVRRAYHDALPELPQIRDWSERRQQKLNARIAERLKAGKPADQVDYWRELFGKVAQSDFLTGRRTDWRCPGLEWLLEPRNFAKVIEGAFDNHRANGGTRAR